MSGLRALTAFCRIDTGNAGLGMLVIQRRKSGSVLSVRMPSQSFSSAGIHDTARWQFCTRRVRFYFASAQVHTQTASCWMGLRSQSFSGAGVHDAARWQFCMQRKRLLR
jgi:hypothetical protein